MLKPLLFISIFTKFTYPNITINGIIFNNDLGPGFNEQDKTSNYYQALDSGYNRIYIGSYQLAGNGDRLLDWAAFTNAERNAIKNYAATKNGGSEIFLYVSGDNVEAMIINAGFQRKKHVCVLTHV